MNPPSGTVTFLFTDIEGSTQLWEQQPTAMTSALAAHDRLLRGAIEGHGGCVFKTVGDAFCAAFRSAPDALAATLEFQRALIDPLAGLNIRVRVGLHTGQAEERDGDYFGPTVNRAARLMSAGHGGQILLSHASRELLQAALPDAVGLTDLGERRLKDLVRPERIWQVDAPGLIRTFAPIKTLDAFAHNLPFPLTSFVGREAVMDDLKAALAANRLVTLTGPGGTGKSRLSLQVAADLLENYPDGVWFVELAPLSDGSQVAAEVATAAGLRLSGGGSPLAELCRAFSDRRVLVLLDNCEHLVEACARLAEGLARSCPRVTVLASSREALGVGGEQAFPVPSLSAPDLQLTYEPDALMRFEAVRLFVDRALAINPRFEVTSTNSAALVQICARLDGIPLALELAACRTNLLSAEQIAAKLGDLFRLLSGGSRTALPRQQTLKALIDWSWVALRPEEQRFLARLSVFSGSFSWEAGEQVAGEAELDTLNVLGSLVAKSLVQVQQPRYRLLETIRHYARQQLEDLGLSAATRDRHLAWLLKWTDNTAVGSDGLPWETWLDWVDVEAPNVQAAVDWAIEAHSGDPKEPALKILYHLGGWAASRGHLGDFIALQRRALDAAESGPPTVLRARVAATLAADLNTSGDYGDLGLAALERAESLGRLTGDFYARGRNLWSRSLYAVAANDFMTARALYDEYRPFLEQTDIRGAGFYADLWQAWILNRVGAPPADCEAIARRALEGFEADHNLHGMAFAAFRLAEISLDRGLWDRSMGFIRNSLAWGSVLKDQHNLVLHHFAWAEIAFEVKEPPEPELTTAFEAACREAQRQNLDWVLAWGLMARACLAWPRDPQRVRADLEESLRLARATGRGGELCYRAYLGCRLLLALGLPEEARALAREAWRTGLSPADPLPYLRFIEVSALAATSAQVASRLNDAALALRADRGVPRSPRLVDEFAQRDLASQLNAEGMASAASISDLVLSEGGIL